MSFTKMCPYCGGGAVRFWARSHPAEGAMASISLCDDCGRFEWL